MRLRSVALVLPFLAACSVSGGDTREGGDAERGSLGKADIVGSCELPDGSDACDGPGSGNCWCDAACVDFGDCCSDAEDVCGIDQPDPEPEGEPCGGFLGLSCDGDNEFCMYSEDQFCGAADHLGECTERPEVCIELFAPVCGCDGNTYGNSCFAAAAGTSVAHTGECEPPPPGGFCGGIAGIQCPEGQICVQNPDSNCDPNLGGADCGGICVEDTSCQPVLCALFCEHGFETDENGCEVCSCAEPPPPPPAECKVAGCSSELCVGPGEPEFSICIAADWHVCLELTQCGNFDADGGCGWEMNPEFVQCMTSFGM